MTVHFGSQIATCRPNPFGECLVEIARSTTGTHAIYATYTGYGRYYHSAPTFDTVAQVTPSSVNLATGQALSVGVHLGIAHSLARVDFGSRTFTALLDGAGNGAVETSTPASAGSYVLAVSDAGVSVQRLTITVHS